MYTSIGYGNILPPRRPSSEIRSDDELRAAPPGIKRASFDDESLRNVRSQLDDHAINNEDDEGDDNSLPDISDILQVLDPSVKKQGKRRPKSITKGVMALRRRTKSQQNSTQRDPPSFEIAERCTEHREQQRIVHQGG
ncbi:MAG: hypothetical protein Q9166_008216 [cf. Caloplaca sp. 2 TL-2023]